MLAAFELEEWETAIVKQSFPDALCFSEPLKPELYPQLSEVESIAVFIYSKVDERVLNALPKLKLVATMSTGYDHIDLAACEAKGVTVCNVPTYGDHTVAQHTFTLLLGITRKLFQSVEQVKKGDFAPTPAIRGRDLHDKIIGVIGTGKIGMNVIKIARGFDMTVIAYDPFPNHDNASKFGFSYCSLDELYEKSDIVTVHVPLLPQTKHLINTDAINKMKHGVIILNTARGGIIETQPLYDGLVSGKVSAAGLDVLEEETHIKEEKQLLSHEFHGNLDYRTMLVNHLLVQHPNVLVTPHNAFNSVEALTRIINTTVENVKAFSANAAINVVKAR